MIGDELREAVSRFVMGGGHRKCLLVVDVDPTRLQDALTAIEAEWGWPRVAIGRVLPEALRDIAPSRRGRTADRWLGERCEREAPGPMICGAIDLLFEPSLALDPLALFARTSRVAALVVSWPGAYDGEVLTYATPAHGHYRSWRRPDVAVFSLR